MKLIGNALSPYAARVMIAARWKGIDLPTEAPEGGLRTDEHLARNPIGKVPVLIDDGLVLPESDVIVSYLEDRFPSPTLFPGDAVLRANARLLTRLLDTYSAPSFGPFLQNDEREIAVATQRIADSPRGASRPTTWSASIHGSTPGGSRRRSRISASSRARRSTRP